MAPAHGQHRSHQRLLTLVVGLLLAMATLAAHASTKARGPVLHVYVREGCPHCAAAEAYLGDLQRSTPKPPWELRLHRLEADPQAELTGFGSVALLVPALGDQAVTIA